MDIFDPVLGGRVRSIINIFTTTYASLAVILGWTEASVKVSVVIAGALAGLVQVLTHHTPVGNIEPVDPGEPVVDPTTLPEG